MGPLTFSLIEFRTRPRSEVEKPGERVAEIRPAVEADPLDRRSRVVLAEALRLSGALDEADSILGPLPSTGPEAFAVRVRLAPDRGDLARADELLSSGRRLDPGLARLRGPRALDRHNYPEAIEQFQVARPADPHEREAVFGPGHAVRLAGREADAWPFLESARLLDNLLGLLCRAKRSGADRDWTLIGGLGATCEALDRIPEARGWYQRLVAHDSLDSEVQGILDRLQGR